MSGLAEFGGWAYLDASAKHLRAPLLPPNRYSFMIKTASKRPKKSRNNSVGHAMVMEKYSLAGVITDYKSGSGGAYLLRPASKVYRVETDRAIRYKGLYTSAVTVDSDRLFEAVLSDTKTLVNTEKNREAAIVVVKKGSVQIKYIKSWAAFNAASNEDESNRNRSVLDRIDIFDQATLSRSLQKQVDLDSDPKQVSKRLTSVGFGRYDEAGKPLNS